MAKIGIKGLTYAPFTSGGEGGAITYTGIPAGIDVTIYETNVATGVTYSAHSVEQLTCNQ